ncbi:hypothetical protein BG015_004375, partial [Linnemannia schmuckeri]
MSTNNKDSSPSSSSPDSSKGKKPLHDITNTVLSPSSPRSSASPTVAGSSRPSAPLSLPLPLARQVRPPAPAEPFNIDTYRSEVMQEWRREVAALKDLEPRLSEPHLDPQLRVDYTRYYEQVLERERGFFAELRRLTVPAPGPPLHADPNLVAINSSYSATLAAHKNAWET